MKTNVKSAWIAFVAAAALAASASAWAQDGGQNPTPSDPKADGEKKDEGTPEPPKLTPEEIAAKIKEAFKLYKEERDEKSLKIVDTILLSEPTHPKANYLRGEILFIQGRLREAEQALRRSLENQPDYAYALDTLGMAQVAQAKFVEAVESFQAAIKADKKLADPHLHLGELFERQQKLPEAEKELITAVQLSPTLPAAHQALGFLYLAQAKYKECSAAFLKVTQLDPKNFDAQFAYGYSLDVQQKFSEAEAIYKRLLAAQPRFPDAYRNLGVLAERKGGKKSSQEALDYYKKYIESGGKDPQVKSWISALEESLKAK